MSNGRLTYNLGNAAGGGVIFLIHDGGTWTVRLAQTVRDAEVVLSNEQIAMIARIAKGGA